jgi:hypothetical protein
MREMHMHVLSLQEQHFARWVTEKSPNFEKNWNIFFQIEDSTDSGTETDDETGGPDDDFTGKLHRFNNAKAKLSILIKIIK